MVRSASGRPAFAMTLARHLPQGMPRADARLGQVLDFMRCLWEVDHALESASKRMLARLGITGPQRLVVRIIGRIPGITAGHLAKVMHVHPSTLTGVLRRLEARRAIVRVADSTDGRRAVFHLTAVGRRLDRLGAGTVEAAVRRALAGVKPSRIAVAREVLVALAVALRKP